ncbi:AAA family ATPase [Methylobacterium trifolii]|uniref:AAA family ATPase n=1 Tax=Methylobacterium trifolii TaxID=1003092 RepID=UPI001EDE2D0A|nr:cellulose synthase operon protein YhjQ/BcsQ [Methylobacterium trifolii]
MQCFIVGADREDGCRRLLAGIAQPVSRATVSVASLSALGGDPRFLQAARPLVLVGDMPAEPVTAAEVVAFAQEQRGHAFTVYVADTIAPDDYKQLVRSGAAEWIQWGSAAQELHDLAARLHGADLVERTARIVSFLPSKGGVGNTTLVVEAASCLAGRLKRGGGRIAVLDLNLQGGTLADILDLEPRFDIGEVMGRPERLDEQLIGVFTSRHSDRLDVFASPARRIGPEEIDPQIVFAFIDSISTRYELILFDLPQHWLSWTDSLIKGSDAVVLTGSTNVPALRKLTGKLAYLKEMGVPENRIATVLNGAEVDLLGRVARRAEIERVLNGQRCLFVRRDGAAVDEAADVGRPLSETAPSSRIGRDVRALADWIEAATGRLAGTEPQAAATGAAA